MTSTHVSSVKRRPKKGFLKRKMAPFLLLSPAVVLVLVVLGYPMLRQFIMAWNSSLESRRSGLDSTTTKRFSPTPISGRSLQNHSHFAPGQLESP